VIGRRVCSCSACKSRESVRVRETASGTIISEVLEYLQNNPSVNASPSQVADSEELKQHSKQYIRQCIERLKIRGYIIETGGKYYARIES
jgi:hypothetical protein